MEVIDLILDIVRYILFDLVGEKQISAKAKKVILVAFIILTLCYIGGFSFCILWGIKEESIMLIILGVIGILLFLFHIIKAVKKYKESQEK